MSRPTQKSTIKHEIARFSTQTARRPGERDALSPMTNKVKNQSGEGITSLFRCLISKTLDPQKTSPSRRSDGKLFKMLFGAHCSTQGGVHMALVRGRQITGECVQFFVKNN